MRFIMLLLVVVLLGGGGGYGYLYYSVKTGADNAVTSLSSVADVSYDSVFVLPDGIEGLVVGVKGINIKTKSAGENLTIQQASLKVKATDVQEMLTLPGELLEGKLPKYARLEAKEVSIGVDSEIFPALGKMLGAQQKTFLLGRHGALGCGNVQSFGVSEYTAMGYANMVLDVSMDPEYSDQKERVKTALTIKDRNLRSVALTIDPGFDLRQFVAAMTSVKEQPISQVSLSYADSGFYKLRNKFCAKQNGSTVAQYVDNNVNKLIAEVGGAMPDSMLAKYRDYLLKGGKVSVRVDPAEAIRLSEMKFYSQPDVMNVMGLKLSLKGEIFDGVSINWGKTEPIARPAQQTVQAKTDAGAAAKPVKAAMVAEMAKAPEAKTPVEKPMAAKPAEAKPAEAKAVKASMPTQAAMAKPVKAVMNADATMAKPVKTAMTTDVSKAMADKVVETTAKQSEYNKFVGKKVVVETVKGKRRYGTLESVGKRYVHVLITLNGNQYGFPIKVTDVKAISKLK